MTNEEKLIAKAKVNARGMTFYAIKNKTLIRSDICNDCGKHVPKTVAHHDNYTKPLDIIWLCKNCHSKRHPRRTTRGIKEHLILPRAKG